MSSKIPAAAVQFVKVANQALGTAIGLVQQANEEKKAAQELIPAIVEHLKKSGWIDAHQTKMAATQLGNHGEALGILLNCLQQAQTEIKEAQARAASSNLGRPDDDANSSVLNGNQKNANYLGYRRGDDDPLDEATRAMAARLGVQLSR